MAKELFLARLRELLRGIPDRALAVKSAAEAIAGEGGYRWVGIYEVTATDIGMLACTGSTPPAFPRFPVSKGLCGSAVARRSVVNVANVQEDPRWLTTFGTTRSEIIVPIITAAGQVIGLIDVESDRLNAFSRDDEGFLTSCAPILLRFAP
ncbi:MAG: GAF domain-containing protein [Candidatus Acidiferrum sp.]|jgi:L-methionine (R)-S-oxide reductase